MLRCLFPPVRVLIVLCAAVLAAPEVIAQSNEDPAADVAQWQARLTRANALASAEATETARLDTLRSELAGQRSDIAQLVEERQNRVDELRAQIDALGPVPEDGTTEAAEVAERREELGSRIAEAQVPLLEALDIRQRTDEALSLIDDRIRSRFSEQLLALGPTPVDPRSLTSAATEVSDYLGDLRREVAFRLGTEFHRQRMLQRLPVASLLILVGLVMIFGLYKRQMDWMRRIAGRAEEQADAPPPWLGTVLILGRLLTPAVGAAAVIWGVEMLDLFGPRGNALMAALPAAIATLIGAYWISHSLFAPVLSSYRLVHLENHTAQACARYGSLLGLVVAAQMVMATVITDVKPAAATISVLSLPLIALGALCLWRLASRIRPALKSTEPETTDASAQPEPFGLNLIRMLRRFVVVIAIVSPILALIGYSQAAQYLLFATIRTLGVLGAVYIVFVALQRLVDGYFSRTLNDGTQTGAGLLPVFLAFAIVCAALPVLALIWGAQRSDLVTIWVWLRDGISLGGARVSLSDFLLLILVFGLGYAVTRFIQSVLRSTVLPRTKLDVGGRNAVVTGIGYVGIVLAALAAITSTGIDLSGLAIVAGALSVGVGFGLQTIVSNFVSGIILLVERPIKQGDWIEVAGFSGYVSKISVRSTAIDTFDRATVIVPNQELIAGTVLNRTHGSLWGRVIIPVGVAYGTDPEMVREILTEIASEHPLVLRRPEPSVLFMSFGADSLDFEIRAYLRDVNNMLSVRSDINFAISRRFTEEGIEIPFAQRDLHLRNVDELARALSDGGRGNDKG